jgi:LPS export ABC transporter protein LptC
MRLAVLGLLACALALGACGQVTGPPIEMSEYDRVPAYIAYPIVHRMTHEGVQKSTLTADTLFAYEDQGRWDFIGVRVTFNNEQGVEMGTLTALTGERELGNNRFVARGDVVLVGRNPNGVPWQLETEELHYDPSRAQVWSEVPFVRTFHGDVTRGSSFRSDDQFLNFHATDVTGRIPGLRFQF